MRLDDTRIIVTGGASGIGADYVARLLSEGAYVGIFDLNAEAGQALQDECGERCVFVRGDVTESASVASGFEELNARLQGIDVLVNNAGVYPHTPLEEITDDEWDWVIRTNLYGAFQCQQAVIPYLKARGGGKIVNIVTNLVAVMAPLMAHYIAAKSGIVGLTRGSACELGQYHITINALAPGAIMPLGDLDEANLVRMRRIVDLQALPRPEVREDLLGPIVFLCSEEADFMTGQILCVDGGVAVV